MRMPPPTGNREFRNEVLRLSELTVTTVVFSGLTFQNCQLHGPAVLVPQGETKITHCSFDAPGGADAIFWEIPGTRTIIVGGIAVVDCTFSACNFVGIGIAGPPQLRAMLESALNQGDADGELLARAVEGQRVHGQG